jgi:glycosyltransferase involved in cell wall biosynthesis
MRVSVVLTVYNATWCVERAVASALEQTLAPAEILVCDDGSTDGTPDLVERRFGDRVRVLRLPHANASATRRAGLAAATSPWLAFLDADDAWRPQKLERQAAFLERHPEVRWLGSDGRYVSAHGVIRESWLSDYFTPVRDMVGDLLPALVERCFPLVSSMVVERRAYDSVGGLDPALIYSHDYDLWLRLAARHPGGIMAESLLDYWTGPASLSRHFEARYRDDAMLMRRIAGGALGRAPALRRRAAARAASLEFDLGMVCLRSGRIAEGRDRLRRAAAGAGPWRRRLLAAGGALLPGLARPWLLRSGFLRDMVVDSRERHRPMVPEPVEAGQP